MSDAFLTLIEQAKRRNDLVHPYAMALAYDSLPAYEWRRMNQAIIDKWSPAGLRYIKDRAWRLAEEELRDD